MIRLVVIAVAVVAVWLFARGAIRFFKTREIDWTGVAFCFGFVVLAFYLRNAIGWG